jgi:hypothetical protein
MHHTATFQLRAPGSGFSAVIGNYSTDAVKILDGSDFITIFEATRRHF